jgi:CBS domain containing-hemolysin-like protein
VVISVEFVPETIFIKDAMNLLTKKRKSVAVVIDEYGGTSGIITIEDIVESFWEIEDEHDSNEELIEKTWVMGFYFSTRFDVEYLNNTYKFAIQKVIPMHSGFYSRFHKIPQKEVITIGSYHLSLKRPQIRK